MINKWVKKGLTFAAIVFFICFAFVPAFGISNYFDDTTPPITSIFLDPPNPDGCNGWYVSNITITLNATDDLSGINATYYRVNGTNWIKYINAFIILEEGENILVEFYSIDNVGNIETVKSIKLDIDKTPPEITVGWEIHKIGCRKWQVTIYTNVTNNTGVIERLEIFLNNVLQTTIPGPGPTYSWIFIIYKTPKIEIKIIAYDIACNNATIIINGSDLHIHARISTHYSIYNRFLHFFERFSILQNLLYIIEGGVD